MTILIAFLSISLAALPLLGSRKRELVLNPALYVFLIALWSVLLNVVYIGFFHSQPNPRGYDRVFVFASTTDFLLKGACLAFLAIAAYVGGYFLLGRHKLPDRLLQKLDVAASSAYSHRVLILAAIASVAFFALYLYLSDTGLADLAFSEKRFQPRAMKADSRFVYSPYYFFKLAMTSGAAAFAAACLLLTAEKRRVERRFVLLFAVLGLLSIFLTYFASLRLLALLLLMQVTLIGRRLGQRRHLIVLVGFAGLTFGSFLTMTLVQRGPPPPELQAIYAQQAAEAAVKAAERVELEEGRSPSRPPQVESPLPKAGTSAANKAPQTPPDVRSDKGPATVGPEKGGPDVKPQKDLNFLQRLGRRVSFAFEGRYLMSVSKLAQIARHFPEKRPYLRGEGLVAMLPPLAGQSRRLGTLGGESVDHYIARAVFLQPDNNVPPGLAGELYINFGWIGLGAGFLMLGLFHRFLFNQVRGTDLPLLIVAVLVVLIPNTTLLLLNSGLVPTLARSLVEVGVLGIVLLPLHRFLKRIAVRRATAAGSVRG